MNFEHTWKAITQPGNSNCFFDIHNDKQIEPSVRYTPLTAWYLSEFCRLIYRDESTVNEENSITKTRSHFLKSINFREVQFISRKSTQCALYLGKGQNQKELAILVFRGSNCFKDWLINFSFIPTRSQIGGAVHRGFIFALNTILRDIEYILKYINCPVIFTGHSQGGALATLAAIKFKPLVTYTYGAPKVGDKEFCKNCEKLNIYRVVNDNDIVATLPPRQTFDFSHPGKEIFLETIHKEKLKDKAPDLLKSLTLIKPLKCFSNHAPINYTVKLQNFLSNHNKSSI